MINVALFGLVASLVLSPTMHDVKGEIALNRAYTSTMIVTNITDLEDDTQVIELEDYNGNVWEYETDSTDLFIDDCVSVLMDNMETPIIYDDEVIMLNYDAWTLTR